jgi:hypothetical protein
MPVSCQIRCRAAVLLVRYDARPTAKRPFAVLLHRIMAKPELPALRQPRLSSVLLSPKGSLYAMEWKRSLPGGIK